MIKKITITNHLNESISIDIKNPEVSSGFFIKSIEGLGPPKSNINFSEMANLDGGFFNSAKTDIRNIVFTIGFLRLYEYLGGTGPLIELSIEDIRQLSYKYFPLKTQIRIEIETDNRIIYTTGYVESNEPDIFSSGQVAIISVLCPSSYFYDIYQKRLEFGSVTPLFEFPFSNESLVSKLIKFGSVIQETVKNINYEGEIQTGFLICIHCIGGATNIEFFNSNTLESIYIDTSKLPSPIQNGDDIFISTVKGNKYAIMQRGATIYNILNAIINDITWLVLESGNNIFSYTADTGLANLQFAIVYDILYQGV